MRMDVLYQADENYAVFGGVSITSLFENNKKADEIYIHFLASGFSKEMKQNLKKLERKYKRKIILYDIEELEQKIKDIGWPLFGDSYATYYKLFIEEFIPDEVERIVYIDCDTAVLGDLSELFIMDMHDAALAIARDCDPLPFHEQTEEERKRCRYNCGVMVINVVNWKKNNCRAEIEDYLHTHTHCLHEQDVINRLYYEEIMLLPCEYNVQPVHFAFTTKQYFSVYKHKDYYSYKEVEKGKKNIKIAHFFHWCGESAWNKGTLHPYRKVFRYYLNMSPWKNSYVPVKVKTNYVLKIEKILYFVMPKGIFLRIWHAYRARHGLALI